MIEISLIVVLIVLLVIQTLRAWMYEAQFTDELKRHCQSVVNHEKFKTDLIEMANQKGIQISVTPAAEEWPDEI